MRSVFSNNFSIFSNDNLGSVRTVLSSDGDIWFVGADVCKCLGIVNPSNAYKRLLPSEKMTLHSTEGHSGKRGGAQALAIVSETGMYTLIMGSRKKEAVDFQRWVTGTVLPSIRKNGGYIFGQEELNPHDKKNVEKQIRELSEKVVFLNGKIEHQQKELNAKDDCLNLYEKMNQAWYEDYLEVLSENTRLKEKIKVDAPKVTDKAPDYFFDNYGNRYLTREEAVEAIRNYD